MSFSVKAQRRRRKADRTYRGQLTRRTIDELNAQFEQALLDFFQVLANELPADTGMSLGSVVPAVRALKVFKSDAARVAAEMASRAGNPKRSSPKNQRGMPPNGGIRSLEAGKKASKYTFKLGKPSQPTFHFSFSINVFHMWLGVLGLSKFQPKSGDWQAYNAALEAFRSRMREIDFSRVIF